MEIHEDEAAEGDALRDLAKGEFKLNDKQGRLMEYITANLKIEDFINCLSEEMWLREVLKDVGSDSPFVRMNALRMWGSHQGFLSKKNKGQEAVRDVEFE